MSWQRKTRAVVALAAVAVAVSVALAFRPRPPSVRAPEVPPADPKALVESSTGFTIRTNRDKEEVTVRFGTSTAYPDGSLKGQGITVKTIRDGGRTFTLSGRSAHVTQNQTNYSIVGDVRIESSDGLEARTEQATYTESNGLVRGPGPFAFTRGRLSGEGVGMTYAKNIDVVTMHERVVIRFAPDAAGAGAAEISAGSVEFSRPDHVLRFIGGMTVTRGAKTIEADSGVAHLSADDQRLEAVELRGQSRLTTADSAAGGLKATRGQNIDLKYGADGETLERARVTGDAVAHVAGDQPAADRTVAAGTLDISLAPDGTTPTALIGRESVELTIPGGDETPARTIRAQTLDGQGEAGRGLTRAQFGGGVVFTERGAALERTAKSGTLDVTLASGLKEIEDARFAQTVRFEEGALRASAANARYVLAKGTLELTGVEPGIPVPQVVNDRISVYATRIDVTLAGPTVRASGAVKSELKAPPKDVSAQGQSTAKMPSMFKEDQLVTATAAELIYDGPASKATYSGNALLWQGDTSIKAGTLVLNEQSGDLTADGNVVTTIMLEQETKERKKERVKTTASSKEFQYDEASRRATYIGDARVNGSQGVMNAARIELFLKASGDELERLEAYDGIALRDQNRETRGARMSYFADADRYEITGTPVVIKEECGNETTGRRVVFDRRNDTIVIDGNRQIRTQTRGSSRCQ
jgi:lipopolysaccharide transport protein LptA